MSKTGSYAMWFCIIALVALIAFDVYLDRNDQQMTISQWVLYECQENPWLPFYIGIGIGVPIGHMIWPQKR